MCLGMGGLVGAAVGLRVLSPEFMTGTGGMWVHPTNDFNAYLVAWYYFVADTWRLPLFDVPAMGYPEGGNVLFNDGLPLTALATKLLYQGTGILVNPFGWWVLVTYVLQGAMAARVVLALGVRSIPACLVAAALTVVCTSFSVRLSHIALSSHFLLLWAIALHFESLRRQRAKIAEFTLLSAISILVNSYLFVMVMALALVTFAALWIRGELPWRDVRNGAFGMLVVVALAFVAGYGLILKSPSRMKADGFGLYSWNLVSLLLPPDGMFGVLAGVTRYGTHGQYEGEAYIGRGALLLLTLCVAWAPRRIAGYARRYWPFVGLVLAFAIYAASNRVFLGPTLLVEYPLPEFVKSLGAFFRATGRFIWPLAYSLAILPVALIFRSWRAVPAIAVGSLAVFLQLQESSGYLRWLRTATTITHEDLIDTPRVTSWLEHHDRVFLFPSWWCGALGGSDREWGSPEANRELQLQLAIAQRGLPSNSVYTSRVLKDCRAERKWQYSPKLEDGVLYFLGRTDAESSWTLAKIANSDHCVKLDWAVVCSRQWVRANGRASPPALNPP
jgi:hypothetical protein